MKNSSDKKDRLERFVRDNRDGFDTFLPQDSLWSQIESQLHNEIPIVPEKSKKKIRRLSNPYFDWRIAAGVFLALGIGFLVYLNNEYGITRDPRVALKVPAYAREFNQYNVAIDQKREEIIKLARNNPELYKDSPLIWKVWNRTIKTFDPTYRTPLTRKHCLKQWFRTCNYRSIC